MPATQFVLASNNPGKVREIQHLLHNQQIEIIPQSQFSVPEIEETGLTFIENAILKARHAASITGLPAIADDSGICVDSLQGAPGIYSARFAGINTSDQKNNEKLLQQLQQIPKEKRNASYVCVMVLLRHANDPLPAIFQGIWSGNILFAPQGSGGFGYDPLFYVPTHHCSAAELPLSEKNKISHRGQALQQLVRYLASHW